MNTVLMTRPAGETTYVAPSPPAAKAKGHRPGSPEQLIAAFCLSGVAVDKKAAQSRSQNWYRSTGHDWARHLRQAPI